MIMEKDYLKKDEDSLNLADIWNIGMDVIWDHKWWYVASAAICLCFGLAYLYRTPDTYLRSAKVIIDESGQDAALRSIGTLAVGAAGLQTGTSVANEIQALSSPDLMQSVVERLHLETSYIRKRFLKDEELYTTTPMEMRLAGDNPQSYFSFEAEAFEDGRLVLSDFVIGPNGEEIHSSIECTYRDTVTTPAGKIILYPTAWLEDYSSPVRISWHSSRSVARSLVRNLSVNRSGKESTVVQLSFKDNFPSRASNILSALIDIYNEEWVRTQNEAARNTSAFINERLVIIEKELGGIENDLKQYKQVNRLTNMDAISRAYIDETSEYAAKDFEVSNQLSVAQYIKDYLNNPVNENALIPANLGLTTGNVETQIAEYNGLILQRDRLSAGSGKNNPLIADLNNSIASLRSAILRSVDNSIATLELQAQKIQAQEKQIMARIAMNSGQELQLLSIQRQQMVKESLYIFLLQKREENELASLVNVGNTRLIERPEGPASPIAPNKMMVLAFALLAGLGIPFAIILIKRISDNTVKSKSDLGTIPIPFLGEIPLSARRNHLGYIRKAARFDNKNCKIIVRAGKRDMMNEAFRVLRTNFDIIVEKKPDTAFVSMLTSFHPDAGKTFIIQNLAACIALKNVRVLIIDLDLRKATVSKALGAADTGIATYLNGKAEDLNSLILKISPGLHLLPVGNIPPNPTELLLSERFEEMMKKLISNYDYIFTDCPPIDIVADAAIVTKVVDMTIFTVRAGMLDKRMIPVLNDIYESGRFTRMAVVLNGVDMESRGYGSYGYRYGYGNN
jgi:capsular exopolysaccharide synthesis family protein